MKFLLLLIRSMRPQQWVKNVFIFAPMIFSLNFYPQHIWKTILAFLLFSLVSSCIYIFNDCFDKDKDKLHPQKRFRPIASELLSIKGAISAAILILLISLTVIYIFNVYFFYIALIYLIMNIAYSSFLKKIVILDVMVIAVGFVLRVQIGAVINDLQPSTWILVITFLLAIFLGLIKRRQEWIRISEALNNGSLEFETRGTLKKYNPALLDQLISVTTSTTLISYVIYVINPDIQQKFHTKNLYFTVPFVVFGIFRYLYLTYVKGKGESPAEIIFSDIPFTVNAVIWVLVFIMLII